MTVRRADQQEPGDTVALSDGAITHRVLGPVGGRPVVFVHGALVDSSLWQDVDRRLAEKGLRTYAPDLPMGSHRIPLPEADLSPMGQARRVLDYVGHHDLRRRHPRRQRQRWSSEPAAPGEWRRAGGTDRSGRVHQLRHGRPVPAPAVRPDDASGDAHVVVRRRAPGDARSPAPEPDRVRTVVCPAARSRPHLALGRTGDDGRSDPAATSPDSGPGSTNGSSRSPPIVSATSTDRCWSSGGSTTRSSAWPTVGTWRRASGTPGWSR